MAARVIRAAALVWLSACSGPGITRDIAAPPGTKTWHAEDSLTVRVDPRIELLGVVQLLAGSTPTSTDLRFPYRDGVAERFSRFADSPAVAMFRRMAQQGFGFDAPVVALLNCSPSPGLVLGSGIPSEVLVRAGGRDSLETWLRLLRHFVTESNFMAFMDSSRHYHEQLEHNVSALLEPDLVQRLEEYYGMRQDGYEIILAPLMKGGFGPRIEIAPSRWRLITVASPSAYAADTLCFFTSAGLRTLVWHEFAHSFVNPLTEAHWRELGPLAGLLDSMAPRLPTWYRQWKPALDEQIVRAVTVRMTAKYRGEAAGAAALAREVGWGFVLVPTIADAIEAYERDRARWPDFESFFPRIIALLASLPRPH
jgi:hypothetical protein